MNSGWWLWSIPPHKGFSQEPRLHEVSPQSGLFKCSTSQFIPMIILWIVLVTQLSAILHAGSLVSCHNFRSLRFSCRKTHCFGLRMCMRVCSLYAKAMEAVKGLAAFTASSTVSVWSRGWIKWETTLRNCSQSVWVSTRAKISLVLTPSSMLKKIGRRPESSTSETVTSERHKFWWITMSSTSPFPRDV